MPLRDNRSFFVSFLLNRALLEKKLVYSPDQTLLDEASNIYLIFILATQ